MLNKIALLIVLIWFAGCGIQQEKQPNTQEVSNQMIIQPTAGNGGIELPEKFAAVVVAEKLGEGRARHLFIRENGDIYVNMRKLTRDGFGNLALRDLNGDGSADIIRGFGTNKGTGMAIHNDYVYFSSATQVFRAKLDPKKLTPMDEVDTMATIPYEGGHVSKPFTFDGKGNMYVNIGSKSNACQEELRTKGSPGIDPCIELETRAGVWKFSDSKTGQTVDDATRYATGIRNTVALDWNKATDQLYVVQHGRDDLHRFWPEHFTEDENVELPAEEFLRVNENDDFGWPYCYYNHKTGEKLLAPEYGGDGETIGRCEDAKTPLIGFPGHWGPNDLLFYTGDMYPEKYKNGAFIAFHGSWNRLNHFQDGFCVVFVPMKDGKPNGDWEIFADNFEGDRKVKSPGNAEFRPTGLAQGPDGSLYISDSQQGRIWRVIYYPEGIPAPRAEQERVASSQTVNTQEVSAELTAGQKVYTQYCQACHMQNGKGVPGLNPPLVNTEWVAGDKERLIKVVLNGLSETLVIDGETYQNAMASHAFLSDQQIADVLTYVRNSFGNDASAVVKDEVAAVRSQQEES